MTKRDAEHNDSKRLITWHLRGRTYAPGPATTSRGLDRRDVDRATSMTDEGGPLAQRPQRDPGAAHWNWDLANGRVEWNERLKPLFGYAEVATDAAWRVNRIHPEDRDRVEASLQRATIVNHGEVWSEQYRFRQADGSYVAVTERAYVVHDRDGPRKVLGAITPTEAVLEDAQATT
jgi:PAS domain S-box-containing protein